MDTSAWVLDASVAAKWFLPSEGETCVEEALGILADFAAGRCRLLVPDLFWPEVANIFWKAARTGRITRQIAEDAMDTLLSLGLETKPSLAVVKAAASFALANNRPVYDSIYVALAVVSGRRLLTADERLVNALGSRFPLTWLGAVAPPDGDQSRAYQY